MPSAFSRLDAQCFRFPPGSHSGNPRSPTTVARATRQEASPTTECCAKAVLGRVAKPLVRVEEASHPHLSYTRNCCRLASSRLSAVLEMALKNQTRGRPKACKQRDSRLDLPHGCGESFLGSATHPWRIAQVGLRPFRANRLAMASAGAEKARSPRVVRPPGNLPCG